jgi:hypothetical protein
LRPQAGIFNGSGESVRQNTETSLLAGRVYYQPLAVYTLARRRFRRCSRADRARRRGRRAHRQSDTQGRLKLTLRF